MFEHLTDRARRVLTLAQEESRLLGHGFIGTEHLLLGLIREDKGIAAHALAAVGVTLSAARQGVDEALGPAGPARLGSPPFTPRAKKVLELAYRESELLDHGAIDTEHLVLGLLDEGGGTAIEVLVGLGVTLPLLRQEVVERVSAERTGPRCEPAGLEASLPGRTVAARRAIAGARTLAAADPLGTHHLLLALFDEDGSIAAKVLSALEVERTKLEQLIVQVGVAGTTDETLEPGETPFSRAGAIPVGGVHRARPSPWRWRLARRFRRVRNAPTHPVTLWKRCRPPDGHPPAEDR